MRRLALAAVMLSACLPAVAQNAAPQTPPAQTPNPARELLQKAMGTYAAAKSYQGQWSYTLTRMNKTVRMRIDIKARGGTRLVFHVSPAVGVKADPGAEAIPEMLVVLDGKTAYFENAGEKVYFKVPLPSGAQGTPLMFLPQVASVGEARKGEDIAVEGKTVNVVEADRLDGGKMRMEIDAATGRIRRIVAETPAGLAQTTSVIAVEKETFDAVIADKEFAYRPQRGFKEAPAPPEAAALFGPAKP